MPLWLTISGYKNVQRVNEAHTTAGSEAAEKDDFGKSYRDMPKSLFILLKNPTFLFSSLVAVPDGMIVAGIANFLSKLIYYQFAQTAAMAGIISGKQAIATRKAI